MKRKCIGNIIDDAQLHGNLKGGHVYGFSPYSEARLRKRASDDKGISLGCRHYGAKGECLAGTKHLQRHHRKCANAKLG